MTNMQKLAIEGSRSCRIFATTVTDLMYSQGSYGRLYRTINEMDDDSYEHLKNQLAGQYFRDSVDVIIWLEC